MKNRILILNDGQDCGAPYAPLFEDFGEVTHDVNSFKLNPYDFKFVIFTGGSDVSPSFYGDTSPKGICYSNSARDAEEYAVCKFAEQRGISLVGICRGLQFLNVMSGGKMMHDIGGHGSGAHLVATRTEDEPFLTNSFHHQMCIPNKSAHILAWSHTKLSKRYIGDKDEEMVYHGPEVEALYVPWMRAVGVQWHPEATPDSGDWKRGTTWFRLMLHDIIHKTPAEFRKIYLGGSGSKIFVSEVYDG